jgi:hypothetical protein
MLLEYHTVLSSRIFPTVIPTRGKECRRHIALSDYSSLVPAVRVNLQGSMYFRVPQQHLNSLRVGLGI